MEKTSERIRGYFNGREIAFRETAHTEYSYHAPFSSTARLQDCCVHLAPAGERLQIRVALPFRIRREEAAAVSGVIAEINETLPENAGYLLEPLDGFVELVVRDQLPEDDGQLDEMLSGILRAVEADVERIMDAIHIATKHIRLREEAEDWENVEDREKSENGHSGTASFLNRLLERCGLVEPKEPKE